MYRVTTLFSGPLVQGGGINQLYFDQGGGTAGQASTAVRMFWQSLTANMHTSLTFSLDPEVELVDNLTGQVEGIESGESFTGTGQSSSDPLPPHTQGLIRWRTGVYNGGREIRGRTFVPGLVENASDNGAPSSAMVAVLTTGAQGLMNDGSSELVVWSRKGTFATVTAASGWSKWASLRSRRD